MVDMYICTPDSLRALRRNSAGKCGNVGRGISSAVRNPDDVLIGDFLESRLQSILWLAYCLHSVLCMIHHAVVPLMSLFYCIPPLCFYVDVFWVSFRFPMHTLHKELHEDNHNKAR
jgi:hypothetical protein